MREAGTTEEVLQEQAGYFNVPGAHLYTVLHPVAHPVARVLLIGPFAPERQFSYHHWTRWARYLAAKRCEVVRFDYRGTGESTGSFEEMSLENWSEDVDVLVDWLLERSPRVPLLLHGIELGAVFGGRIFASGRGDALLMWSPPQNANHALRTSLRRWAAVEQFYESPETRRSASEFIRELESGNPIEVQGYHWSSRLWKESFHIGMPSELNGKASCDLGDRPMKAVTFGKNAETLALPFKRYEEGQDFTDLYSSTSEWISNVVSLRPGDPNASTN